MSDCYKKTVIKKSIKEHICGHCYQEIPKGVGYVISSGIYDNEVFSIKGHHECLEAYELLNAKSFGDEWYELREGSGFKEHQYRVRQIYNLGEKND